MRANYRSQIVAVVAVIGLVVTAAGCGGKKEAPPTPTPTPTPSSATPTPTPSKTPSPTPKAETWPLTGLPGPIEERPAVAIKIENSSDARPQTGLEFADMVWEEMVEGGIPRFVAVYHSNLPKQVGPIRSVRPMDGAIVGPTKGLLVFSGGQGHFIKQAKDAGLQVLSEDTGDSGFTRLSSRSAPHNVYADPADFLKQANKKHKAAPPVQFVHASSADQASAVTSGQPTSEIRVTMSAGSHPNWTWDAAKKVWLRFEGSSEAVNADDKQLSADNVVGLLVKLGVAPGKDPAGNPIPETLLTGKDGTGFVASAGKYIEVKWSKAKVTDPIVLKGSDGSDISLAPGRTWIELIPRADGSWEASQPAADTEDPEITITEAASLNSE